MALSRRSLPRVVRLIAWLLGTVLVTGACTASGMTNVPVTPPVSATIKDAPIGPYGDAFYQPPTPRADAKPGDLVWVWPISGLNHAVGYTILYWSSTIDNALVAVSGVVYWPAQPSMASRPIIAWAHGLAGLGDQCAPSKWAFTQPGRARSVASLAVQNGAVFVAMDYQGFGPPGDHPYLVGAAAGHNILDSIRAAATLTNLHTTNPGAAPPAVVFGESQGGRAALSAAEVAPTYAPTVNLRGSVAVAPPSHFTGLARYLDGTRYFDYTLMTIDGLDAAYPELIPHNNTIPQVGQETLTRIKSECGDVILARYAGEHQTDLGIQSVLSSADFQQRLMENDPGQNGITVPILLVHGEIDDTIPVELTKELAKQYCAAGVSVSTIFLHGKGHANATMAAAQEIKTYLFDRLNGKPAPSTCTMEGN
jgi:pimeloyl-ACP methyl ester carboxylesterase